MALENKKTDQIRRSDFETMDEQRWAAFDCDLRIRMARSKQAGYDDSQQAASKMQEQKAEEESHAEYEHMTRLVRESIEAVVPPKTWSKKNGRIVSDETKALYEARTRQYQASKPTQEARKRWNRKIRSSCRKDYRTWVTKCVHRADRKGR